MKPMLNPGEGWTNTSYGSGPFHPAIQKIGTREIWYWPNITFPNEDDAATCAYDSLVRAYEGFNKAAQEWNIWPVK